MAKLILKNGQTKTVDYNTAAKIFQTMEGTKLVGDPLTKEQLAFLPKVAKVDFEDGRDGPRGDRPWERPNWWKK